MTARRIPLEARHVSFYVTTQIGGSLDVWCEGRHAREEQNRGTLEKYVAHLAWCELMSKRRGFDGKLVYGNTARMLEKLCDQFGVARIKDQFTQKIEFVITRIS